jgi:acetoin utilization deacetylase AcuC-like enzyme
MLLFYTDEFVLPLPEGHTFPMVKYRLLRERILESGMVDPAKFMVPQAVTDEQLSLAHDPDYIQAMSQGKISESDMKRIGFPWSLQLVERSRRSSGATLEAGREALKSGWGINLAGGTHHAFRDHGEGYCLFNDSVVAVRNLQKEGRIRNALIVDLDVHQGNGTAAICRLDPTIYTFSMHGKKNYPLRKEVSDLDIELEDGTDDQSYLDKLENGLNRCFRESKPDLVIYLAGSDPYHDDRLGRLSMTKAGLAQRDCLVFDRIQQDAIPIVVTMAGGYAREVSDTVDLHWQTVREVLERCGCS